MKTVSSIQELRAVVAQARTAGRRIALTPTMGNLHDGHASLVRRAVQMGDFVVASIFVNPLQFGPNEDLDTYPRTLAADQQLLIEAGCDLLFTPSVEQMYPNGMGEQTRVSVPGVSSGLCGGSRPGHFDGVSTVVCKLFQMVQPDLALFGEKDYQQLAVIRTMVRDLNMPIEILGVPTVRATDGLALSSRNGYLDAAQRSIAPNLYATLQQIANALRSGQRDYAALIAQGLTALEAYGFRPDYLEIREAMHLQPATSSDTQLVVLVAAWLGNTRLIDNLALDCPATEVA